MRCSREGVGAMSLKRCMSHWGSPTGIVPIRIQTSLYLLQIKRVVTVKKTSHTNQFIEKVRKCSQYQTSRLQIRINKQHLKPAMKGGYPPSLAGMGENLPPKCSVTSVQPGTHLTNPPKSLQPVLPHVMRVFLVTPS